MHAVGVCDDPALFHRDIDAIAAELAPGGALPASAEWLDITQGMGLGYAQSTPEELAVLARVARETGVVLDPVYSGKALCAFCRAAEADPERWRDATLLFVHTGGAIGGAGKAQRTHPARVEP